MLELGGDVDLALEPFEPHGRAELLVEHLEGDQPVVPEIPGEPDIRSRAVAQQRLDRVPTRERLPQRLKLGGNRRLRTHRCSEPIG
jgi:hypothetical protein